MRYLKRSGILQPFLFNKISIITKVYDLTVPTRRPTGAVE